LSKGLADLADTADSLASRSIPGLLRTAPDLIPNLENVESMFETPETCPSFLHHQWPLGRRTLTLTETANVDELVPCEGKDEAYDEIQAEIEGWEKQLSDELEKLEKRLG
jgi:DNA mismatch repair protein MSH6